jgi:hypothetical protein
VRLFRVAILAVVATLGARSVSGQASSSQHGADNGPAGVAIILPEEEAAALVLLGSISHGDDSVAAMIYWYDGRGSVQPVGALPTTTYRFERDYVRINCKTLESKTLTRELYDAPTRTFVGATYSLPNPLPHERADSPRRQIANVLCASDPPVFVESFPTIGAAESALEARFKASRR